MRLIKQLLFVITLAYIGYGAALFSLQRHYIYFPNTNSVALDARIKQYYQPLEITTSEGSLTSWYHPATTKPYTLVYLHGNSGNILSRLDNVKAYMAAGYGIVFCGYPGFGGNPGNITETAIYSASRDLLSTLNKRGIPPQKIVLYGESLGSGVAVQLATEIPVAGVVLQSPYTSLVAIGQRQHPFYPVSWLMSDRFDSLSKIKHIKMPILFLHGALDQLVPLSQGQKLFEAANSPKYFMLYPNSGHNNMVTTALEHDVLDFLAKLK